ncbi:MAG: DUF4358 domain-containing protein [Oscillospiraceae bacterium]|nr:DUF4358 domain-containing protein [Oscillospiraceae bacterium]
MKKETTFLLSVILFSTLFFSSCEQINSGGNEIDTIPPAEITDAIIKSGIESGNFPEMAERGFNELEKYYFGIDLSGIIDASYWIAPAGAYSDEITVIMVDSDIRDLDGLKVFFEEWVEDKADMWRNYNPEQAQKLDNAAIEIKGNYIAIFVCENTVNAVEIFNSFI